ncbi:hypothetical protein NC661_13080 [Aquibacillus koreensis]|uniref:Uncharacterized protein n=1 Tax=Aquibacillus koreensis TaxID=279446 RepID=A0A9X3WPZ1_9BACI|nr:hypothetical protein [Aquibacillus koreensis]MCT2536345.1 hypothetical protein [Aquibacillus koreensis]MDC3421304.1 hypothetical protein [Aquibacillus koreensis]
MEKLRGAIIFLGICILFAGCTIGGSANTTNHSYTTDYSYELSRVTEELEKLNDRINTLTQTIYKSNN